MLYPQWLQEMKASLSVFAEPALKGIEEDVWRVFTALCNKQMNDSAAPAMLGKYISR